MSENRYREVSYTSWRDASKRSALAVAPHILELVQPTSVVDVGCGLGMWAASFSELGVATVHGMDGHAVPTDELLIPAEDFRAVDLSQAVEAARQYDLVVSLEVGEHLPERAAETFVRTLTSLGSVVMFSSAVPYQRGANHVNEQWPEYWARLFGKLGYRAADCMRPRIWNDENVEPYYCQNMIVYVKEDRLSDYPGLAASVLPRDGLPLSLIHPRYYLKRSSFQGSSLKWWGQRLRHLGFALFRRLRSGRRA